MSTCGEDKPHTTEVMTAMTPLVEHSNVSYYWSHNAEFRVEGKVYCVPIYPFIVGSQHFVEKHGLSTSDNALFNSETVIDLKGVTIAQFLVFLKLLFPTHQLTSESFSFTKEEWLTILTLSTLWHFHEVRALAVEHLDGQLSELELIDVGRAAYVSRWVVAGYKSIVERPRTGIITAGEARAIGHETVCQLWTVRYQVAIQELAETEVQPALLSKFEKEVYELRAIEADHRTKAEIARAEREAEEKRKADELVRLEKERLERLAQEEIAEQKRRIEEEERRKELEEQQRLEEAKRISEQAEIGAIRHRLVELFLEEEKRQEEKRKREEERCHREYVMQMRLEENRKREEEEKREYMLLEQEMEREEKRRREEEEKREYMLLEQEMKREEREREERKVVEEQRHVAEERDAQLERERLERRLLELGGTLALETKKKKGGKGGKKK